MADQPPVVAELGRPETPDETADRKAEASRRRRANQTAFNLVLALLASLAVVAFLVAVVVRPDAAPRDPVDYQQVAAQQSDATVPLLAPTIPVDWYANDARIRNVGGVRTWAVGFITAEGKFLGLDQGIGVELSANPSWLSTAVNGQPATGSVHIGGIEWTVFDHRDAADPGLYAYALSAQLDGSAVVLHGTASDEDFALIAAGIVR